MLKFKCKTPVPKGATPYRKLTVDSKVGLWYRKMDPITVITVVICILHKQQQQQQQQAQSLCIGTCSTHKKNEYRPIIWVLKAHRQSSLWKTTLEVRILLESILRPKDLKDRAELCRYTIKMYLGDRGEGAIWVQLAQSNTNDWLCNTVLGFINA